MTVASYLCRSAGAPLKIPPILGFQRIFSKSCLLGRFSDQIAIRSDSSKSYRTNRARSARLLPHTHIGEWLKWSIKARGRSALTWHLLCGSSSIFMWLSSTPATAARSLLVVLMLSRRAIRCYSWCLCCCYFGYTSCLAHSSRVPRALHCCRSYSTDLLEGAQAQEKAQVP